MAAAGVGSRRECEQMILEGRVLVDGQVVDQLGTKVDPDAQTIHVDGEKLRESKLQYFMLNKPPGVVSTARDPAGRLRVVDLIKTDLRVYNVGRLDKSSEGLILVTNDGDLANGLTHPRFGVQKKYHVLVKGRPTIESLRQLKRGVHLAEGYVQVADIRIRKRVGRNTMLEIVLDEGRNREIRRLLARIGHKVLVLRRIAIGPLQLGDLPVGAHRRLTIEEVAMLRLAIEGKLPVPNKKPRSRGTRRSTQGAARQSTTRSGKKKATPSRSSTSRTPTTKRKKIASSKKSATGKKSAAAKTSAKTSTTRKRSAAKRKTTPRKRTTSSSREPSLKRTRGRKLR